MDVDAALHELGLDRTATWTEIKQRYRAELRQHHPDVVGDASGSDTSKTAQLIAAFDTLEAATSAGERPLPGDPVPSSPPAVPEALVLRTRPGNTFHQLLDAAHALGEVTYVDPEANLLQVLIQPDGAGPCQLVAELAEVDGRSVVSFSLVSLTEVGAPPIESVVAELADLLAG